VQLDRRGFLKLFAASTAVRFLPPPSGWFRTDGGLLSASRSEHRAQKTAPEIQNDFTQLPSMSFLTAQLELLGASIVGQINCRCIIEPVVLTS
jgi:hypothetical protein